MNARKTTKQISSQYASASRSPASGTHDTWHLFLGAHRHADAVIFRVWAPFADAMFLCGDFNDWDGESHPLHRAEPDGIWEISVDARAIGIGHAYRYRAVSGDKDHLLTDPFGYSTVTACDGKPATKILDLSAYKWRDSGWMRYRAGKFTRRALTEQPINIYEIHPSTCMRTSGGEALSLDALARELAPYVKQMGYTHVELMTPSDTGSCIASVFDHGTPADWMGFVDSMHEAGIGVILDWSPAAAAECALRFARKASGATVGTRSCPNAALAYGEIRSMLLSSALATVDAYHLDGIYIDVAALFRHDECPHGLREWSNSLNICPQRQHAAAFLMALDKALEQHSPDLITVADDRALSEAAVDARCFSLRRDTGWTEDILAYMQKDPLWRKYEHQRLVLPLSYAFSSNYLLSLSHGDVDVDHGSLLDRMPGEYAQKFANVRLLLAQMMLRPGKKQLFMGCEIGTFRAWASDRPIEWFLTDHAMHASLQQYCADLNLLYLEQPALHRLDASREGFAWIDADKAEESVCSFCRRAKDGSDLVAVFNFTPVEREGYPLHVPHDGVYEIIFNSDAKKYGGGSKQSAGVFASRPTSRADFSNVINVTLPPLSALVFRKAR